MTKTELDAMRDEVSEELIGLPYSCIMPGETGYVDAAVKKRLTGA